MSGQEIAGKDAGDLALFVERDVEEKTEAHPQRDVADFLPQWIAFSDSKGGAWIADVRRAVIAQHGLQARAAGHDSLRPAAEAGKEMRFDESGDNADVGLHQAPIDQRRSAVARRAQLNQGFGILRLVIQRAVIRHDSGREQRLQLRNRVRTVRAELVQQGEVFAACYVLQVFQKPGNDAVVRGGSCDISEGDADPVGQFDKFAERTAVDRGL